MAREREEKIIPETYGKFSLRKKKGRNRIQSALIHLPPSHILEDKKSLERARPGSSTLDPTFSSLPTLLNIVGPNMSSHIYLQTQDKGYLLVILFSCPLLQRHFILSSRNMFLMEAGQEQVFGNFYKNSC